MKLGKLLAAGKSMVSGRRSVAYRESKQAYLPKFSPKNPFTPPPQNESPKASLENPVAPVKKVSTPAWSQAPKSATTWTAKLNPLTMLRGSQEDAKAFLRPAVQAELSLDSVKVVHNDLTDADVEIVPIKSRPQKVAADLSPARASWEILGERLLKATAL